MINYEKLDKLMELPVSEEILGAYIEGNLSATETDGIDDLLNQSDWKVIVQDISENSFDIKEDGVLLNVDNLELPIIDEINIEDNITKNCTEMNETLSGNLAGSTESMRSIGTHMIVGEEAVNETSSYVKQSYEDTCAIKAQQLVLRKFGKDITEDELVRQACDNGWYHPGKGTSINDMGKLLSANEIPCTNYMNGNIAHVVNALADGKMVIMGVDSGELWETSFLGKLWEKIEDKIPLVGGADHALIVAGIDASDPSNVKVILTDPGTGDYNKPYPLKQFIDAAEDSRFFMTVTDDSVPDVFKAYDPGTTHLPQVGDLNYYQFKNMFSDYMQDGSDIPDDVWSEFKSFAVGSIGGSDNNEIGNGSNDGEGGNSDSNDDGNGENDNGGGSNGGNDDGNGENDNDGSGEDGNGGSPDEPEDEEDEEDEEDDEDDEDEEDEE